MIIVRTPFRISFFGGGTDYPSWYQEHGGMVLATTIDKYCYITCRYLPPFFEHKHRIVYTQIELVQDFDEIIHPAARAILKWFNIKHGLEIHYDGDLPARSGLGTSSSFTVSLLHGLSVLCEQPITKKKLASNAIHIEQNIIKESVGCQDQISAAFGGFNRIEFKKNSSFKISPLILKPVRLQELQNHLMLLFTGFSRISSEVAQSKIDNFKHRELELTQMMDMVDEAIHILQSSTIPIQEFGKLLHQSWCYKRTLSQKVSTPTIDKIYETAIHNGAIGGKILGAGGGGFLLLFVEPSMKQRVTQCLSHLIHVPFAFENMGSKVVFSPSMGKLSEKYSPPALGK